MAEQRGVPNQLFDVMSFHVCDIHAFVTRYEKRDHLGYFIDSLFLVWIVCAISVESNGASFVKKEAS